MIVDYRGPVVIALVPSAGTGIAPDRPANLGVVVSGSAPVESTEWVEPEWVEPEWVRGPARP
jgi:hypothetical protein